MNVCECCVSLYQIIQIHMKTMIACCVSCKKKKKKINQKLVDAKKGHF